MASRPGQTRPLAKEKEKKGNILSPEEKGNIWSLEEKKKENVWRRGIFG